MGINNQQQHGSSDYFIAAYRSDSSLIWADQVGAYGGDTGGQGIATDNSGNIYITGDTNRGINGLQQHGYRDYFIAKYYKNSRQWTQQVGAANGRTFGQGIATDNSGNVYVTGDTDVGINGQQQHGNSDYFVVKYAASGIRQWAQQVGVAGGSTGGDGIATDSSGNAYLIGQTTVGINGKSQNGGQDYFVVKYDTSGNLKWTQQVGVNRADGYAWGSSIATDDSSHIYITGDTNGGLNGQPQNGDYDAFTTSYKPDGTLRWSRQVGG